LAAAVAGSVGHAQPPTPKPGPEIAVLSKLVGTWDCTVDMMGQKSKGKAVYKTDLGGLWIASTFEGDMGGMAFSGRGYDSYDEGKKKYVSVWMDSMTTSPMVMEGSFDKATRTMTMVGDMPGPDGKMAKHKIVTKMPDDNTMEFAMYVGDGKDAVMTIQYKRKKTLPTAGAAKTEQ
jgi:hypothetical protein